MLLMNRCFRAMLLLLLLLVAAACGRRDDDPRLEEALRFAGENRAQLEQVLRHYAHDSLNLAAAHFLIENMPGHYSYTDTAQVLRYSRQVGELCRRMRGGDFDELRDSINAAAARCGMQQADKTLDSRVVTADYLIANIDEAFRQRKEDRWAQHLN